jgi:hypothetical protein
VILLLGKEGQHRRHGSHPETIKSHGDA